MPSASGETANIPRTRLSQQELTVLTSKHRAFLLRKPGGTRASFKMRDLSHLDLSGLDLTEADFSGAKLFSTRLLGSNLSNADLYGTDMRLANLTGATMTRTDLRGACLRGAILSDALLLEADLRDGTLLHVGNTGNMSSVNGEASKLTTELTCATMRGANLSRARVSNAFVMQTDMTDAIMRGTKFIRANLTNSDLTGADLQGADLTDANLSGARLSGAILSGAQFGNVKLTNAIMIGVIMDDMQRRAPELVGAIMAKPFSELGRELPEPGRACGLDGQRGQVREPCRSRRLRPQRA